VSRAQCQAIFITGTDTGVGKTVFTALLLAALHQRKNVDALAIKLFCSGDRDDALLLSATQRHTLSIDEVNPFYFAQPLAPFVAAELEGSFVVKKAALAAIERVIEKLNEVASAGAKHRYLLIEGAGGLMAPLGLRSAGCGNGKKPTPDAPFTALDLMRDLKCSSVVVAPNRLGMINHTLLTLSALRSEKIPVAAVVVSEIKGPAQPKGFSTRSEEHDISRGTNPEVLRRLISPVPLFSLRHIGGISADRDVKKRVTLLADAARQKQLKKIADAIISSTSQAQPS
jgi:dethiobiotin synthetase